MTGKCRQRFVSFNGSSKSFMTGPRAVYSHRRNKWQLWETRSGPRPVDRGDSPLPDQCNSGAHRRAGSEAHRGPQRREARRVSGRGRARGGALERPWSIGNVPEDASDISMMRSPGTADTATGTGPAAENPPLGPARLGPAQWGSVGQRDRMVSDVARSTHASSLSGC